jgi:uncharacterized membrane protein (DUF441 family)
MNLRQRLMTMAAGLWWGSLTAIGFIAVPLLFRHLPTPRMAGEMAAQLFAAQTWVSVACGALLLVLSRKSAPTDARQAAFITSLVTCGMLLALLIEFAVAPHIRARDNLALWHGLGTVMYAVQWLCAGALLYVCPRPDPLHRESSS